MNGKLYNIAGPTGPKIIWYWNSQMNISTYWRLNFHCMQAHIICSRFFGSNRSNSVRWWKQSIFLKRIYVHGEGNIVAFFFFLIFYLNVSKMRRSFCIGFYTERVYSISVSSWNSHQVFNLNLCIIVNVFWECIPDQIQKNSILNCSIFLIIWI